MSEQSVNIVVTYAYQKLGADLLPEDERWGYAKMHMVAEHLPTTEEEKIEVGRTIGLEKGYEMVGVMNISLLEDEVQKGEVVVGEVVVDGNTIEADS